MRNREVEIFKKHIKQAKKANWPLYSIIFHINHELCPFDCVICNRSHCFAEDSGYDFSKCDVFNDKKDYCGKWRKQTKWYRSLFNKLDLIKIAEEIWNE